MVRIAFRSLFNRAVSIIYWLVILASLITITFTFGRLLVYMFSPPSGIVRHELTAEYLSNNTVCTPLWPDNFNYGVKVYSSFESDAVRNTTKFFESAKLLWHVDSVSTSNKYPKLASSVKVDVPSMLYSADNRSSTLYAHIFIQAADNLLPYPNIYDKYLVYSTTKLVYWRPIVKSDNTNDTSPEYELVAATKIPWAIYLENYTYKWRRVPLIFFKAVGSISRNGKAGYTYKPPVLDNTYTETAGKVKQLALLQPNGTLVTIFDSTAFVQLKLQGVWRGWIKLRELLDDFIDSTNFTYDCVLVESNPKRWKRVPRTQNAWNTYIYPLLQKKVIVPLVTAFVLIICSLTISLVYLKMSTAFWSGPKSNWDDVSRVSFLMQCLGMFVEGAKDYFTRSRKLTGIIGMLFVLDSILSMIELPYNPLQWPEYITSKIALYKHTSVHNSYDGADNDKPEQAITTIRRNVDSTALKWIRLVYPPIIVAIAFHALAYNADGNWGVFKQVVERSNDVLDWICLLPQIILNHKIRSGSLTLPVIEINYLFITIFRFSGEFILGQAEIGLPDISTLISFAASIIFIIQWILYR